MAERPLRSVKAGEKPPAKKAPARRKPMTVSQAAASEKPRELLVAMRARIALAVENPNTPARDLAALSRRLLEIAREIEAIDAQESGDGIGEALQTPDEAFDADAL